MWGGLSGNIKVGIILEVWKIKDVEVGAKYQPLQYVVHQSGRIWPYTVALLYFMVSPVYFNVRGICLHTPEFSNFAVCILYHTQTGRGKSVPLPDWWKSTAL